MIYNHNQIDRNRFPKGMRFNKMFPTFEIYTKLITPLVEPDEVDLFDKKSYLYFYNVTNDSFMKYDTLNKNLHNYILHYITNYKIYQKNLDFYNIESDKILTTITQMTTGSFTANETQTALSDIGDDFLDNKQTTSTESPLINRINQLKQYYKSISHPYKDFIEQMFKDCWGPQQHINREGWEGDIWKNYI